MMSYYIQKRSAVTIAMACSLLGLACGGPAKEGEVASGVKSAPSSLETYFPLENGKVYAYIAKGAEGSLLTVLRVERKSPERGSMKSSNAERIFTFGKDAIERVGGGTLLKLPLQNGTHFKGEHGGTTVIEDTDVSLDVPAGHFANCLRTVEQHSVSYPAITKVTFCPGIGIVKLEVQGSGATELMELQSYGDPVKI
jgi:hypothetical protein